MSQAVTAVPQPVVQPVARLVGAENSLPSGLAAALRAENIEIVPFGVQSAFDQDIPAVVLVDGALPALRDLPTGVVCITVNGAEALLPREQPALPLPAGTDASLRTLRAAFQLAAARLASMNAERELSRTQNELNELHRIGMALMTERDPDRLLVQILEQATRLTNSDAGSLYLSEDGPEGPRLRFKLSRNATLPDLPLVEFTLPIDKHSVAGYAAVTGDSIVIEDAYALSADAPYTLNRSFDERFGYRTKSMLVVPMRDHRGTVVGVLQLINRKDEPNAQIRDEAAANRHVLPYGDHEQLLVGGLAGQAAVSIENSRLYAQIQNLFESFVKAAVTAIDQRDPTTAGHSIRVAALTVDLASAIERASTGPHRDVTFTRDQMRELRYAAMLHDFGKVGVREEVLVKSKKLPPFLFERVHVRFDLIRRTMEAEYWRRRAELVQSKADPALLQQLEQSFASELAEIDQFHAAVRASNEPTILPEESATILKDIAQRSFRTPSGEDAPYISTEELHFLSIPRGTLDERERLEIESHVEQTYKFLSQIPWTDDLRNLAEIAYGHHEKMNGRGYPRGIKAQDIPIQTRMMTIADIFDALTASDRPYKRAVPTEKALDILRMEAKDGLLDASLVDALVESNVYRRVLELDWREL